MPKLPHPLKPVVVSIMVDRLRIIVPAVVVVAMALALVPGAALLLSPRPTSPAVAAHQPSQEWTTGTEAIAVFANVIPGTLPPPDPRQGKPPCRTNIGQEAINGYCWQRLPVPPPCPPGESWEHERKCYVYALKAIGVPTSGDVGRASVADP